MAVIREHCWNHSAREGVGRCPGCRRVFCRECVTEHGAKLLCATCVAKTQRGETVRQRRLLHSAMAVSGLFVAWAVFFVCGQALSQLGRYWELTR